MIVPTTVAKMESAVRTLAVGDWWESVVDMTKSVNVLTCSKTAELTLQGVEPHWKDVENLPLDAVDTFTALMELAFHGFGGGGARMSELRNPTMFYCVFHNESIYYSMISLKVYNHVSQKVRHVKRKLPPIVGRYFLLFRSMVQWYSTSLYHGSGAVVIDDDDDDDSVDEDDQEDVVDVVEDVEVMSRDRMLPSRINRVQSGPSKFGPANVMQQIFNLEQIPLRRRSRLP